MNPELPKESTPVDSHILETNGTKYDVYKLIHVAEGIEVVPLSIASLEHALDDECWKDANGVQIAPREVILAMANPDAHPSFSHHLVRIREVDTRSPILLSEDGRVLDGMHRLARLAYEGNPEVMTKTLDQNSLARGLHVERVDRTL